MLRSKEESVANIYLDIDKIFENPKDILVMWETNEHKLSIIDFDSEEEVANFIGTNAYFIKKTLNGKKIKEQVWKPNIFFKPIDEEK